MPERSDAPPRAGVPVDVLLVSPQTTPGWRRADADFARLLEELGVSVVMATSDFRVVRHLRRTMQLTDLAEAAAMRRALTKALRSHSPRAIVYSTPQATLLQPRDRLGPTTAVRFDSLTIGNRPGRRNAVQHRLERRSLAHVGLLLPFGLDPSRRAPEGLLRRSQVVELPLPVEAAAPSSGPRERFVLCYAGNPEKKGLETIARAWTQAAVADRRLVVAGIDQLRAKAYLRARQVPEPTNVEWAGAVSPARFRELTSAAEAFVSASRFEDYGLAQLEALVDGALLVTSPSDGPYEALPVARALGQSLVARDSSPAALAEALLAAFALPEDARAVYRKRALELLEPYSWAELRRRVRERVLPVLLGAQRPAKR